MSVNQLATFHLHYPDADVEPMPVRVRLSWDPADPVAIKATFQTGMTCAADVTWIFSRSLLADGILAPAGCGDVRVLPAVDGQLRVVLDSPSGHADFSVDVETICEFLAAAFERVPNGAEFDDTDVEAELLCLLEAEAS